MTVDHREGRGETPFADVADCLCDAVTAIERTDYNVLTEGELQEVLDAHDTLGTICRRYRRQQGAPEGGG